MSAISRKVEWVKLRDLRADEQELVRKRYRLHGRKLTTVKIQVVYTDGRIDSFHAPDCEWPNANREFQGVEVDQVNSEWAGDRLGEEVGHGSAPDLSGFQTEPDVPIIWVPAPCTCWVNKARHPLSNFVRPYLGLYATCGTQKRTSKKEMPTLVRFVPRPLTLAQALEFEEVTDVPALRVLADALIEHGDRFGEVLALTLHKHQEAA